jgi:hypothetical protein
MTVLGISYANAPYLRTTAALRVSSTPEESLYRELFDRKPEERKRVTPHTSPLSDAGCFKRRTLVVKGIGSRHGREG